MSEVIISINSVTKDFGNVRAVNNANLDVLKGEFFSLLGSVRLRQNHFATYAGWI